MTTKVKRLMSDFTAQEVVVMSRAIEAGVLDDYKPKHIITAGKLLEDVIDDSRPLLLSIGQASKEWGITPALIKELVSENRLSPILICNSKWRFKYEDINPVIEEGRI